MDATSRCSHFHLKRMTSEQGKPGDLQLVDLAGRLVHLIQFGLLDYEPKRAHCKWPIAAVAVTMPNDGLHTKGGQVSPAGLWACMFGVGQTRRVKWNLCIEVEA